QQVRGEHPEEIVYTASWRTFTIWLKHEYAAAPWEWIIVDGRYPVDFGDERTEDEAANRLEMAVIELIPDYGKRPGGLRGFLRSLLG
ncbi:MAG TPA: hypothetical protein VNH17_02355, partial [Streptosporangiaceae bacterium]|nr:hypothetical protein [Streptosporangiaceae bacterium]